MNNSKIFVLAIALLLVVAVLIELSVPKRFVWEPTFSHDSKQPFGCALFDSLAKTSVKHGYSVKHTTFYQLLNDSSLKTPLSVVDIYSDYGKYSDLEIKSMLDLVSKGNKLLICNDKFQSSMEDTLQFLSDNGYFSVSSLKRAASRGLLRSTDSLVWDKDSVYPERVYKTYSDFISATFLLQPDTIYAYDSEDEDSAVAVVDTLNVTVDEMIDKAERAVVYNTNKGRNMIVRQTSPEWEPLAWKYEDDEKAYPIAMRRKWGRGEIVICTTPLLFTNYGVMERDIVPFVYRVLNTVSDNPILRIAEKPLAEEHISQSPMRYFIANPPLRWAVYLALLTLLLFFIFTARRRQRAIPIVKKPENHQLEFTKLIGTLYYQDGAHADLVRKKYSYFTEFLRREVQIDIDEDADDEENFNMLARHTGMPVKDIGYRIKATRKACRSGLDMTVDEMMMYIDYMNEIEKKLTNS